MIVGSVTARGPGLWLHVRAWTFGPMMHGPMGVHGPDGGGQIWPRR